MALIGKIRQKTGLLLGFIGVSLLIFLVQEAISSNSMMSGSVKSLGKINGQKVDAAEFFDEVSNYENRLKTLNPNLNFNEQTSLYIREEVWNNFAVKDILGKTIDQLGLSVTDDEMAEAFKGANIHPFVMNILGQSFINPQTGMLDKAAMENALNNMDKADPMLRQYVMQLEPLVEQDRVRTKYASLVAKSAYYPSFIAKDNLSSQKMATVDYLSVPYSSVADDAVKVTDEEIVAYIKKHAAKYKREENVVLDIVTYDIRPSLEDQNELRDQLLKVKEELQTTDDDSLYIARSSVQGGNIMYANAQQIKTSGRIMADSIINAPVGSFVGPYTEGENIVLTYIADRKPVSDSVRASRIILGYQTADDVAAKKALADKIVAEIKAGTASFAQKALELSDDPATKQQGGDVGFIPQGALEPALNQKLFYEMNVGQIEVMESQNGVYILQKTGQTAPKTATRIVDFANELIASDATAKEIYNEANQFFAGSKTAKEFDENAKTKRALKNITVYAKDISVAGLDGTRSIIAWAFKEGEPNAIQFFDLSDKYAIVKVAAKNEAGLASIAEVKNEVTSVLTAEKKAEVIKKKLGETKSATLDALVLKAGGQVIPGVIVQYSSPFVDGVGVEPKLVGTIFGTKEGTQSAAVSGTNGVYVAKTLTVQSLAGEVNEASTEGFKKQLYRQNSAQLGFDKIFESILKNAKIEDQRYLVY